MSVVTTEGLTARSVTTEGWTVRSPLDPELATELTVQMTNEELAQAIDAAVAHYKMLNFEAQVNTRNHIAALQKVQLQRALCVVQKDTK